MPGDSLNPLPSQPTFDQVVAQLREVVDTLRMHRHTGSDLTQPLLNTPISQATMVNASTLGDGVSKSGTLTLSLAAGRGDVFIKGGSIADGDFANAGAGTGFILGIDDSDSDKTKFYFGKSGNYIKFDGAVLTVVGSLAVSSLDIPDTTTASSFHTDSSGNSWWGANVATGYAGAKAYILASGIAQFQNPLIGGTSIQYTISDNGMFSFGDGSDGAATFDGSATPAGATKSGSDYTLTRDVYYTNMTISTGCTVNPAGYRIFGTGALTLNGTGVIKRNGNNGTDGVNSSGTGTGGPGGASLADGYLKGSAAGGDGGNGAVNGGNGAAGGTGANTTNSLGSSASGGGAGGNGSITNGGAAGSGGSSTASNVRLIANWHLLTLLDVSSTGSTVKFNNSAAAGGGGGGGADGSATHGCSGGGGGSAGGIVAIYFRNIVIGASASIIANGGNGGKGGSTSGGSFGNGGGGGGGNGGIIVLVYNTLTNSGSITASAGAKGVRGTGGSGGSDGTDGTAGTIYQFKISM